MEEYHTLSIASLGNSTLSDAKSKPQIHYVNYNSDIFSDLQQQKKQFKIQTHQTNDVSDIDGARPRTSKERNYVSKSLNVDDIDGARARFRDRILHTKRHTDPLQPEYQLPKAEIAPPENPPFHRDPLMIDDIEGTRTSHRKIFPGRDFSDTSDIEGTKPGWKPLHLRIRKESAPHDIFPVTENPIKKTFARSTKRETDPMRPSYFINSTYYCDDDKSKPKRLPQYISDNHLLKTSDIEGAQAGYRSEHFLSIPNSMRKEFRNTNFINDIEGAQANTKKSTFVTTRCSNPLQPVYKSLDGDALIGGPVDGLVPADLIDKNTYNFKSFGTIPQSSSGIKSSNPPISRRSLSAATSRDSNGSSQYIQPEESKLNFISTSTTSQYFDMDSSQERRNSDDIAAKSYAEKIHMDSKFLITEIPLQSQNQNNHHDKSSNHSSSNQQPRRSLSAVPRLSRDLGVPLQATNNSSRIVSSRRNEPQSNCSSQVSTSRSHQSSGRKLRSDSLSSKRQQAELDAEISAIRGL